MPDSGTAFEEGHNLMCGVHGRNFRLDSDVSAHNKAEALQKFYAWVEGGTVCVDVDEMAALGA